MSAAVDPPRGLVVAAGMWFIFALLLSLGTQVPLHLTPASLAPSIRVCLIVCAVGSLVAWPLVRLSLEPQSSPRIRTMLDAVTIALLYQMVLWPLRLATPWPVERTLLIGLTEVSSLVGTAGLVAIGWSRSSNLAKSMAMIGCLIIAFGLHAPLAAIGISEFQAPGELLPGALPTLMATMEASTSMPTSDDWSALMISSIIPVIVLATGFALAGLGGSGSTGSNRAVAAVRRVG